MSPFPLRPFASLPLCSLAIWYSSPVPLPPPLAHPRLWPVTVFGLGLLRPAPGTWGSLPPVILAAILIALGASPQTEPFLYHAPLALTFLFFSVACILQGDLAEHHFAKKDPGSVCADETAGQSLALVALPISAATPALHTALWLLGAFLAFRILDIVKPFPCRRLQYLPSGWGILADDLIAGLYALLAIQLISLAA